MAAAPNPETWKCPNCSDVMPAKFMRTHPAWCAAASALIEIQVDRLIERCRP